MDVTAFPSTGTSTSTVAAATWVVPHRIIADDGSNATCLFASGGNFLESSILEGKGFSHTAVANSFVRGLTLTMIDRRHNTKSVPVWDLTVRLLIGGTAVGDDKASTTAWSTSVETVTYGSSLDMWGLTSSQLASVDGVQFGVQHATTGAEILLIDAATLTWNYVENERPLRYLSKPHVTFPGSQQPIVR